MGCNCATQEQIKKLHELYGSKKSQPKTLEQKVKEGLINIGVLFVLILTIPVLISLVLYKVLFTKEKKISVKKLLGFSGKGIDEAIAKNIIENTSIIENE